MVKTIGIIAPSYFVNDEKIAKIEKYLNSNGYKYIFAKNVYKKYQVYAGTVKERVDGIEEIYTNKNVDIVLALRGGDGCLSIIDFIDYDIIKKNPKPLFGYSDISALHSAIIKNTNQKTFYSLNASNLVDPEEKTNNLSKQYFLNQLKNISNYEIDKELHKNIRVIKHGFVEGISVGGNITVLEQNIGTQNDISFNNKILFLEDAKRNMIDFINTLVHMKRSGKLNKIKGLILGEIFDIKSNDDNLNFSIDEILKDIFYEYDIPIIINAPFGHGANKSCIPLNEEIILNTNKEIKFYIN